MERGGPSVHAGQSYLRVEFQTQCHPADTHFSFTSGGSSKETPHEDVASVGKKRKIGKKVFPPDLCLLGIFPQLLKKKGGRNFSKTFLDLSRFFHLLVMLSAAIS